MCDLHVYLHVFNSPWAILWIYVKYTCTLHIKLLLPYYIMNENLITLYINSVIYVIIDPLVHTCIR
jgi:hypothetical protein